MRQLGYLALGWLAVAVAAVGLVRHAQDRPARVLRPVRLLTYPLDDSPALRFQMDVESRAVRLITWQTAPADWSSDPRVTDTYCLHAVLRTAEGVERETWTRWLSSRRSIGALPDYPVLPAAWLPEREQPVSDDRQTILILPDGGRSDDVLEVRRCDPATGDRILVVAHSTVERNAPVKARMVRANEDAFLTRVLRRYSARSWLDLPELWRDHLVAERWARLAALEDGDTRATVEVHTTFERSAWRGAQEAGTAIPPGGAVAFNLDGETRLGLAWLEEDGSPAADVETEVRIVHGDGTIEHKARVGWDARWSEGDGVRSVQIGLPADAPRALRLQAWTEGGGIDRAWGDPPRAPIDPATDRQWLAPDLRNVELARALPTDAGPPVSFRVDGATESVRFRFIVPLPPDLPGLHRAAEATSVGPSVEVLARDASGTVLERWRQALSARPSIFERYTQLETPGVAATSAPIDLPFDLPEETATLDVWSSGPVDVQLKVASGLEDLRDLPWDGYDVQSTPEVRPRYVPLLRSRWQVRGPTDPQGLLESDRIARVDLQVRLEPDDREEAEEDGPRRWHALPLTFYGDPGRTQAPVEHLVERDRDGRPQPGARVRLGARSASVEVPATGRLALEHVVAPERVGQTVTARIGGETRTWTQRTTTGQVTLHDLPPGRQALTLDPPDGPPFSRSEFWLARATAGTPLWVLRRVRTLSPNQTLRVAPLPAGPAWVRLYVYGATDLAQLAWTIEPPGGTDAVGLDPDTLAGQRVLRPTPHAGWLVSKQARFKRQSQRVTLRVPEGVPAGARLRFAVLHTERPVYVRALASWPSPRRTAPRLWALDTPAVQP